jgi:hypothetical protein
MSSNTTHEFSVLGRDADSPVVPAVVFAHYPKEMDKPAEPAQKIYALSGSTPTMKTPIIL